MPDLIRANPAISPKTQYIIYILNGVHCTLLCIMYENTLGKYIAGILMEHTFPLLQ